jgi:hypothetical protein
MVTDLDKDFSEIIEMVSDFYLIFFYFYFDLTLNVQKVFFFFADLDDEVFI